MMYFVGCKGVTEKEFIPGPKPDWPGFIAMGTAMEPLPVTGLAANFSSMLRIALPPFGVKLARTTHNPKDERFITPGRSEWRT